jgi:PKD repeat protein
MERKKKGSGHRLGQILKGVTLALATGVALAGPPEFAPGAGKANQTAFPWVDLPARVSGEQAIGQLGATLPEVAAYYGKTPAAFIRMLREDDSAWIDVKGRLLYVDKFPQPAGEGTFNDSLQEAPYPLNETFTLNSRPGSKRVIYLDFNGHQTTGTAWNASSGVSQINSPAYSTDGNTAFSDSELGAIQAMWRQVAEDFAPFDVNITTEDPGLAAINRSSSSDDYYGTRVVITEDNFDNCGCGGFAYLTAFNDVGDYYKPAFVFNSSIVGAGEAITHEVGHNLSLSHDGASGGVSYYQGHGSGPTGWAPIMGVGYNKQLVQWSKGEYSGANETEDDLARIPVYGAPFIADDHGGSSGAASALDTSINGSQMSLSGSGLIHQRSDVDIFSFLSGGGAYTINVDPVPVSPNLDIRIELRNSAGALVASSNPGDSLPAAISGDLVAGEYFLSVDGVGKGSPLDGYSDYGSLGRYSVAGTVPDPGGLAAPQAAVAAPAYAPGIAPLYVSFDGSGSTDSDGYIDSWDWDFGDGASASGALVNHTYNAPGAYSVTLTVTDNDNLSDNDSLNITVNNQAPVAVAGADISFGIAPVSVAFSSTGSYDPDASGSISAYDWDFGDGGSSSAANPSHIYTAAGSFNAVLTVTDNMGGANSAAPVVVDVDPPPYVDQYSSGEQPGAGTVSGNHQSTHAADLVEQSIRERESGGRKSNRYSYLQHTWVFNVQPGDAATLSLTGRQSNSSDGDQMQFAWSLNGGSFQSLPVVLGSSASGFSDLLLAGAEGGGEVRVRVTDSDQGRGNRSLDAVHVDQIRIRTDNQGGEIPVPDEATGLGATAGSSSQVDLSWTDTSGNETGFRVERSANGSAWNPGDMVTVGANQQSYSDIGLNAETEYFYRVFAFNSGGDADNPSNTAWDTTQAAPAIDLTSANGYKVKGRQWVSLAWAPANMDVYRDNSKVATVSGTTYEDSIGKKGGGSYTYKVCIIGSPTECSNARTVTF